MTAWQRSSGRQPVTKMRTIPQIEADIKAAAASLKAHRNLYNEGGSGYDDESKIAALAAELVAAQTAASPLTSDLAGEQAWFNCQGFRDAQTANTACLRRGYSYSDLCAAGKAAKAAK